MPTPFIVRKDAGRAARIADTLPAGMLWRSRSVAVCRVTKSGRIQSANDRFHALIGSPAAAALHVDGCFSSGNRTRNEARERVVRRELITRGGRRIPVVVETVTLPRMKDEIWLIVPATDGNARAGASQESMFALLHGGVARSVETLARNLHRVSATVPETSPAAAELVRSSLALVEQCSLEVSRIGALLQTNGTSAQKGRA